MDGVIVERDDRGGSISAVFGNFRQTKYFRDIRVIKHDVPLLLFRALKLRPSVIIMYHGRRTGKKVFAGILLFTRENSRRLGYARPDVI